MESFSLLDWSNITRARNFVKTTSVFSPQYISSDYSGLVFLYGWRIESNCRIRGSTFNWCLCNRRKCRYFLTELRIHFYFFLWFLKIFLLWCLFSFCFRFFEFFFLIWLFLWFMISLFISNLRLRLFGFDLSFRFSYFNGFLWIFFLKWYFRFFSRYKWA